LARLGALAADVNCRYNDRVGNASPQKIRSKLLNELWRRARVRPDWSKVTVSLEELARATKIPFGTGRREADFLHNDQSLGWNPGMWCVSSGTASSGVKPTKPAKRVPYAAHAGHSCSRTFPPWPR
jgi:hypothetical protein